MLAAALAAVALAGAAQELGVLDRVEDETVGLRFELRGAEHRHDVVLVEIDDTTFSDLRRQWPFPRSLHARAIDRLQAAGARTIVYDVQFTEPTGPREDRALYEAVARAGGMVLATTETDGRGRTNVLGGDGNLARAGARAGAANLMTEAGGVVRRFPDASGGLPTIAVATAEQASRRALPRSAFERDGAWIDFAGPPGTIPSVSFSDLLAGRVPDGAVRGRIAVVGVTAPTLRDVHATPLSSTALMSGPEIQANAISTALRGLPLRDAPGWAGLLALVVLGLAPAFARLRFVGASPLVTIAVAVSYACVAHGAFALGVIVPVTYPLLSLALGTVASIGVALILVRRDRGRIAERNDLLERRVRERTRDLWETQLEIVRRLAQAAELRDHATGEHIERISALTHRLALAVGLPAAQAELLGHASSLHDVGKIGIPDRILLKPGALDEEEWVVMRTHTTIGAEMLGGSNSELLQLAEKIALTHHERWDGSGYPAGLRGEEIPLEARICAVCDVYDALVSPRHYKPRWTHDEALEEVARQRGRHFDPALVDAFLNIASEFDEEFAGELRAA